MNSIEQEIANSIQAMETGESRYIQGRRIVTQSEIDLADMEARQALEAQQSAPEMMTEGQAIVPQLEGESQPIPGTRQGPQAFGGVEDQTNIDAIAGPVDSMGVGEFLGTTGRVFSGALGGAATATLGLPGDVIGIVEGIVKASGAPDGEGLDAFLQGMGRVSEMYGSAATTKMLYDFVDRLEITDEAKEQIKSGSALLGEWGEIPGVAVAAKAFMSGVEGLSSYAAGAADRVAERGAGMTLQSGFDPMSAVDEAIVGAQKLFSGPPVETKVVSSRLPTAKAATEDPLASRLQVGIESSKADEKAFNKNAAVIQTYPNITATEPMQAADELVTHVKDNLLYLYDSVPPATRERSKQWYVGARKIVDDLSVEYEVPDQSVAGVMAVLSPQKDWFMNVSLGKRVIDIHQTKANEPWTDDMMSTAQQIFGQEKYAPILQGIAGKTYSQLETPGEKAMWLRIYDQTYNPREHNIISPEGETQGVRLSGSGEVYKTGWGSLSEIAKAIDILDNPSVENISGQLGSQHKVRSFYNNMYAPMDEAGDVTIDTHAVAAGLLRPLSGNSTEVTHNFGGTGIANSSITGAKGTYGLYAEAYRQAAKERGILPREMQSITWEAIRGLFNPRYKGQASNVQYVDNIWSQYKSGELSLEEARNAVIEHAGGIEAPEWERSGGTAAPEVQDVSDTGQLSGAGVSGPKPKRSGRGTNSRNSRRNQTRQVTTESPGSGMEGDQ